MSNHYNHPPFDPHSHQEDAEASAAAAQEELALHPPVDDGVTDGISVMPTPTPVAPPPDESE